MTKKLLEKTTRNFLILAIMILLISAPLFYLASHALYIYEADEVLLFHKEDFLEKSRQNQFTDADLALWNRYNHRINIIPDTGLEKDSLFSTEYFDNSSQEHEPFRELWAPVTINGKRYTYTEKNNLVVMEGMVVSVAVMFLMVIGFLMIGIIWLSKRSTTKLWAPFYDTLNQIKHFELDKSKQPRLPQTDIEEFSQLNKSLEMLLLKNVAIFKSQREFVENAAHELQTPLALFQTKIDSLAQLDISSEQALLLNAINKDVARLTRLNKNLLLLSRIEDDNYPETEKCLVNESVEKHFDFFNEQAAAKKIAINTEWSETVKVASNPVLLDVLVNNLFLNAIRHNVVGGSISIKLKDGILSFANTGERALPQDRLFHRFSKINPSGKGNGLGLAIVKKVAELNGWEITYRHQLGLHIFSVKF